LYNLLGTAIYLIALFLNVQVSDNDSGPPTPAQSAGIVGALMEVMQKRSKAIHSSGVCVCELYDHYSQTHSALLH